MKTLIVALYNYQGKGLDSWHDHGAGMTYTAAKNAGCDVHFLDMKTLTSDAELQEALKGYDLIAFGLKSSYYSIGMKVIRYAKALGSKVLIAGYHVTAAPEQLLENPDIDWVFHGESEITFPQFLQSSEKFEREIWGEKPQNLNDLPFMDRTIYMNQTEPVEGWWRVRGRNQMISVMAARGCPYNCSFCQPIERNHFGAKLRRRSVDSMINELKWLKDLYHPDCVMIHDDTFLIQPKWIEEFIERYPEIGLPFWAAGRADGICQHKDLVGKLVKVGWELVSIGFESGSQRMLDKMKKGTTVAQNIEAASIVKNFGAKLYANYMLGLPWETKEDIQATMRMADQIGAEIPSWAFFTPYPGCDLGEECMKQGWSLLDRNNYNRCPSGRKVKYVDYGYLDKCLKGFREEVKNPFCDIIIPTYNNEDLTVDCINSIKEHTKPETYRIIWVDNASTDTTKVEKAIADVNHKLIRMPSNEGFVGAINTGLKHSDAEAVCLLNNDTRVSPNWLEKLTSTLFKDSKLGILGALTEVSKGPGMDSHHSLSLHNNLVLQYESDKGLEFVNKCLEERYSGRTTPIAFVAFLCAVIKREVINKIGLLDPNYKMGMWDDNDYNIATRRAGWRTELALDTCIYHKGRSTFNVIQKTENFDVGKLLRENKRYLDLKWETSDVSIISRAVYDTLGNDRGIGILTPKRLELMQKFFIGSLKNQTDSNFILYIITGHKDNEATKAIESLDWSPLNVKFLYTDGDLSGWRNSVSSSNNFGREADDGCPEDLVRQSNHPKSSIMARLDTDDWVAPGWVAHMNYMARVIPDSHFLINYQVIGQDSSGRLYNFNAVHNRGRTSPFISLIQRTEPRLSPYADTHLRMGSKFASVYNIPPSYAFMVVHGENRSNRVYAQDTYIGDFGSSIEQPKVINFSHIQDDRIKRRLEKITGSDWKSRISRVRMFKNLTISEAR
ncbi:MAG: glycosyltransferase [Gammaproteobacteria bacterium]|uniref:Putative glycosyltransferase n=1 Tax=viral metagenome TaxID=1070528 RepID=A0A6H1ZL55_9ZZZZ|nr:glycosyltransferase [Gammaproteobacteria bacterium]MBU2395690.1 glycosyltransferase [Gammaproteobacteria bacterium]